MSKKKKLDADKKSKSKKINRYNVFQRELSSYLRETNANKNDFKLYKSLYKQIDKEIPIKRFSDIIPALIKKSKVVVGESSKLDYTQSFPFYNAQSEFGLPKYAGIKLRVLFNDGGADFDFEGSNVEFKIFFSGDIVAYFRNNYNESSNMANFVLLSGNSEMAVYEIQVEGSAYGSKGYIEKGSQFLSKSALPSASKLSSTDEIAVLKLRESVLDKELELIKQLKELGFTNEEIKKRLGNI